MSTSRDRAVRTIVAAVLSSDLSTSDLRALAHDLMEDRAFSGQLGELILRLADDLLFFRRPGRTSTRESETFSPVIHEILGVIKRRRMPKGELATYMERLVPNVRNLIDFHEPVASVLVQFAERYPAQFDDLALALSSDSRADVDEYLKSIMKRR